MNGKMVAGKPLYVALAQRKEDRRARLQVIYSATTDHQLTICFIITLWSSLGIKIPALSTLLIVVIFCIFMPVSAFS